MAGLWFAIPGFIIWLSILLLPWRPWSTRESLDVTPNPGSDLSRVTVLIPARNESEYIAGTLGALADQGTGLQVIVINDRSTDDTAGVIRSMAMDNVTVVDGQELASGWSGKIWSLEQGRLLAGTEYVLLLDADISLKPGILATLLAKSQQEELDFISLMADLRMDHGWEKLLMPAFIYFFKLLYPFRLSNSQSRIIAAAAGGCIFLRREVLEVIGGFAAIKGALIDDCALARQVKDHGYRTWTGLTHSVISNRRYENLRTIWDMVTRTAYTQLRYSVSLLLLCTALMVCAFIFPLTAIAADSVTWFTFCLAAYAIMIFTYLPTLRYYGLNYLWSCLLPVSGFLFLLMTWSSAVRYWTGSGSTWKGRNYTYPT